MKAAGENNFLNFFAMIKVKTYLAVKNPIASLA